jgi:hypothetical protein
MREAAVCKIRKELLKTVPGDPLGAETVHNRRALCADNHNIVAP